MSDTKQYSLEVQDVMGIIPSAIIRTGTAVIFLVVLVLVFFSWLIKYPEIIESRVVLTTKVPPLEITNRAAGILFLFKKDGDVVKQSEVVGYLKNSISYEDITMIKNDIRELEQQVGMKVVKIDDRLINQNLILGNLQPSVINLKQSLYNYNNFKDQFNSDQQIQSLIRDKERYRLLNSNLERQKRYSEDQLVVAKRRFAIDSLLLVKRVIAPIEFDKTKVSLSQSKSELESTSSQIINNSLQISKIDIQIKQLQQGDSKSKVELLNQIISNINNIKADIANWEYLNLLKAPISGAVSFRTNIVNNQFVNIGEKLMVLNPDSGSFVCTAYIPMLGFGRLAIGQKAIIKFDNFPYADYGSVSGLVQTISPVPVNDTYMVGINLNNGLKTSYSKNLKFNQEMQGTVEIITRDQRLIERVFNKFTSLFANN